MRTLILAATAALAFATAANAATQCHDAKTGKFIKCPPPAAAPATAAKKPPKCVKGKLCGMSCIKATDVCHKP